ncbi:MAG: TetR/AcrR family transcriptional regulator [Dehalococcoidia bacterium]|nr:TetR/AcrR family transcriptional regulator [Dehalococcoidia bacterium]
MPVQEPARHARSGDTRTVILDASLELFGRDGYEATTVRRIADRCGITDAALYYYFDSKQAILDALFVERWSATTSDYPLRIPQGPVTTETLVAVAEIALERFVTHDAITRLLLSRALADDVRARELRKQRLATWRNTIRDLFDERFRPEDVDLVVDAFMWVIIGFGITSQASFGRKLADAVQDPEFREHYRAVIRRVAPVDELAGCRRA